MSPFGRMSLSAAFAVAATVATIVAVPASAAPTPTTVGTPTTQTVQLAAIRRRAIITFDKNWTSPSNSTLTWKVIHQDDDGVWRVVEKLSWRAGSGMLGKSGRNECRKGRGWLPNGTYRLRFYNDYHGNLIKGRAIYLGRKACANGTVRTDLFIHTEQGAGSRQCPDRRGDQVCRWEYPKINDYRSYGCIKLAPGDLHELHAAWARWFPVGSTDRVRVVVR
jgi:hypothetical protein